MRSDTLFLEWKYEADTWKIMSWDQDICKHLRGMKEAKHHATYVDTNNNKRRGADFIIPNKYKSRVRKRIQKLVKNRDKT